MSVESLSFDALGSSCHLFGVEVAPARLNDGRAWVLAMHARLTRFDAGSELSQFNAAAGEWADVSPELEQLLRASLLAFELSGGLVNVAVLRSMLALGYTRTFADGPTEMNAEAVSPLEPLPDVLEVKRGRARLHGNAGIDLGGIAKGWLADGLAECLGPNAVANLGGDLRALGGGPDGEGWPVGVGGETFLLGGDGAATSGTWRRRWFGHHHLIDPRTGLSSQSDLSEVSVVAATAFEAEVYAKTALLLGREAAPAFLAPRCPAWRIA